MDASLSVALSGRGGVARSRDLAKIGLTPNDLRGLVRCGSLVRLRHGAYIDGARYHASTGVDQHLLAVRAVAQSLPRHAISHLSAVAWWELPVLLSDLGPVHVSGIDHGRARKTPEVRFHAPVASSAVTQRHGIPVVRPAVAVAQAAVVSGVRAGLVAADAGLRAGVFGRAELLEAASAQPRPRAARRVADLASARSESPGESLARLLFADLGLPQPLQQADIRDERGRFVARVDFLFEELGLVVEFDGAVKYAGADGRQALVDEKRREDELRRLGYRVVRLTWRDLADPERVARLLT